MDRLSRPIDAFIYDNTKTLLCGFYRAMLCIRGRLLAMGLCPCLSQVGVLSKRLNESSWFLARELHSTRPTPC